MAEAVNNEKKEDKGMNKSAKIGVGAAIAVIAAGITWGISKIFKNIKEKK
jgi:hypothetical protein